METDNYNHKINVKVRFSDLDAMGHVNNASYLSYLEEARLAYYHHVMNMDTDNLDFDAVVARIEIDYVDQIKLGDNVEIYTRTAKIGNKSSDVEHLIVVDKNGAKRIAAKAMTKLVSFDYKKGVSMPVPDDAKKTIKDFEGDKLVLD